MRNRMGIVALSAAAALALASVTGCTTVNGTSSKSTASARASASPTTQAITYWSAGFAHTGLALVSPTTTINVQVKSLDGKTVVTISTLVLSVNPDGIVTSATVTVFDKDVNWHLKFAKGQDVDLHGNKELAPTRVNVPWPLTSVTYSDTAGKPSDTSWTVAPFKK